jgi:hypothetical protein
MCNNGRQFEQNVLRLEPVTGGSEQTVVNETTVKTAAVALVRTRKIELRKKMNKDKSNKSFVKFSQSTGGK